jgi:hypothetical protein
VRVYVNLHGGHSSGVPAVPLTLTGRRPGSKGKTLGTLLPEAGPSVLRVGDSTVDTGQRTDPRGAYTFTLPPSWAQGELVLEAIANPAHFGCTGVCVARSRFTLSGIHFRRISTVHIWPLALTLGRRFPAPTGGKPVTNPASRYDAARVTTPLELDVLPYVGGADVADIAGATSVSQETCAAQGDPACTAVAEPIVAGTPRGRVLRQALLVARLARWGDDNPAGSSVLTQGLLGAASGDLRGGTLPGALFTGARALGYADVARPFGAIAHGLGHALGRRHASACGGGGGEGGQLADDWPPDQRGAIQGIGLDTRAGSGGSRGPYRPIAPGAAGGPAEWLDLISYCAPFNDRASWISPRGWGQLLAAGTTPAAVGASQRPPIRPTPVAGNARGFLRVVAVPEGDDGAPVIVDIARVRVPGPAAAADSPYRLEALDKDGKVMSSVPMRVGRVLDGDATFLTGEVPVSGVTAIVVRGPGARIAARTRSAHAPSVTLPTPKRRADGVLVRWSAKDADPGDHLTTAVQLSLDDGKSFRTFFVGRAKGSVVLPSVLFTKTAKARVRVRVDDGFILADLTSQPFAMPGARPRLRITDPIGGASVRADALLYLRGEAIAAGLRRLSGGALRWFDGGRQVGTGAATSVGGLSPGRHVLRLVAHDGKRSASAIVRVNIVRVRPQFLALSAPAKIGKGTREILLRVAASVSSKLTVNGEVVGTAGPAAKTFRVGVRPGAKALTLAVGLRSGPLAASRTLTIAR